MIETQPWPGTSVESTGIFLLKMSVPCSPVEGSRLGRDRGLCRSVNVSASRPAGKGAFFTQESMKVYYRSVRC